DLAHAVDGITSGAGMQRMRTLAGPAIAFSGRDSGKEARRMAWAPTLGRWAQPIPPARTCSANSDRINPPAQHPAIPPTTPQVARRSPTARHSALAPDESR